MISLFPWQLPFAERQHSIFTNDRIVVNNSDTGTGKTFVSLDTVGRLGLKFMVVCPKSVLHNWHWAAKEMGVDHLLMDVINWEKLHTKRTQWYSDRWRFPKDNMLFLVDEVHKGCSGVSTITGGMFAQVKAFSNVKVLALSATMADTPLKMRALGYHLDLHKFNLGSFYSWCRASGCYDQEQVTGWDRFSGCPITKNILSFPEGDEGKRLMLEIRKKIEHRLVRARISEIPDFPECVFESKLYDLGKDYTKEVNKIYSELSTRLSSPGVNPMVEKLKARQRVELYKVPLLADLARDTLESGDSPVIFVNFRDTVFALQKEFPEASIIIGEQKDRDEQVARFQNNETKVCLATCGAGGTGISLHDVKQERRRVAYVTPSYNASDMVQVRGRIWRSGGTKAVQQFVLAAGTIEEKVHESVQRKLGNIETLNDGDLA